MSLLFINYFESKVYNAIQLSFTGSKFNVIVWLQLRYIESYVYYKLKCLVRTLKNN